MFVSIEGIDGCGKTTQIKLLEEYLSLLDVEFAIVREPGGARAGEEIRRYFSTRIILYAPSRNCSYSWLPALRLSERS